MAIEVIQAYKTTDGKIYVNKADALDHEKNCELLKEYNSIIIQADEEMYFDEFMDWLNINYDFVERAIQFIKDTD